jgi:Flp pilus assembly protein TadG
MFVLSLVLVMGAAALVIDVGFVRTDTAQLQNALDAGALAAAQQLPTTGAAAAGVTTTAQAFVHNNYPSVPASSVSVTYDCLISSTPGTFGAYVPTTADIATNCPNFSTSAWTCTVSTCYAPCSTASATCNMIGVSATSTQAFTFGRVFGLVVGVGGVNSGTVNGGGAGNGNPVSYAENSPQAAAPVDVVLVVDRTGSMSGTDTTNARAAAGSIVTLYKPATEFMALGMLGPSKNQSGCTTSPDGSIGTAGSSDLHRWVPVGLSGAGVTQSSRYAASGQVVASDYSLATVANNCYTNSGTGTDLADPLVMAQYELDMYGNPAHTWGIILETDGQPNTSTPATNATDPGNYCEQANTAATNAKNDTHNPALGTVTNAQPHAGGIVIFTIGFGLNGSNNVNCPDRNSSAFHNKTARQLLVSAASSPALDNNCDTVTNTPITGQVDHFFCVKKTSGASANLSTVFAQAASALASGAHLIQLPVPPPIITSITPAHGSLTVSTTVNLTGQYFSTAFAITGAASFTVNSDSTITAVMPAHSAGTVNVTVTDPGGTSNAVGVIYP